MAQPNKKLILWFGIAAGLAICAIVILCATAIHHSDPDSNHQEQIASKKDQLLEYLNGLSGFKTILGIFIRFTGSSRNEGIDYLRRNFGVTPGVLTIQLPSYSDTPAVWQSVITQAISDWNNGYLIHLVWWGSNNPLYSMSDFQTSYNATIKWTDLTTDGTLLNKKWTEQLEKIVPYLQQLQIAGVVANCELLPYANSHGGYIWSNRPGINGTLRLFQLTHEYLTKNYLLNSLLWTWSLYKGDIALRGYEEYWPGSKYVDFVSVYMGWCSRELSTSEYVKLLEVVGDTPISMEWMCYVPTPQILAAQPKWTWFTIIDDNLVSTSSNPVEKVTSTVISARVINGRNATFFNITNQIL